MSSTFRRVTLRHFAAHKLRTRDPRRHLARRGRGHRHAADARLGVAILRAHGREIAGKAALQITTATSEFPKSCSRGEAGRGRTRGRRPRCRLRLTTARFPGEAPVCVRHRSCSADQELATTSTRHPRPRRGPLGVPRQPDSIAVSTDFSSAPSFASTTGWRSSAERCRELTVRASLDVKTGPRACSRRFAVMDVFAAQRLFDLGQALQRDRRRRSPRDEVAALKRALGRV